MLTSLSLFWDVVSPKCSVFSATDCCFCGIAAVKHLFFRMGLKCDAEAGNIPLSESDKIPVAFSLPYCCTFLYFL